MLLLRLRWIFLAMVLPGCLGLVLALSALFGIERAQLNEQTLQTAQMLSARFDIETAAGHQVPVASRWLRLTAATVGINGAQVLLLAPGGTLVEPAGVIDAEGLASLRASLRGSGAGLTGPVLVRHVWWSGAFCRSATTGYTVTVLAPSRLIWLALGQKLLLPGLELAAILLLSLLLMRHFGRQMQSSLAGLARAVDAAASGRRDLRVSAAGPVELIRVARRFNQMIAALRTAEAGQERLNRALRLVSECNSVLVHERDETSLLTAVCRLTVESGGYLMAWIGVPLHDEEKTVQVIAQSGYENGYLDNIRVSWGEEPQGLGPTGTALRLRAVQINQNYLDNPLMAPWREAALQRGYQASIALPLCADEALLGVLTIYAREAQAFGPDEVVLLEQLADDLAFGMSAIRTELARQTAVREQARSEESYRRVLDNAADAVLLSDPQGRISYANLQAELLLGSTADMLCQRALMDIAADDARNAMAAMLEQLSATHATQTELSLAAGGGKVMPVEVNAIRLPDGGVFCAYRDITERKRFEAELRHMATHDELTGLVNRQLLGDRIEQALAHEKRSQGIAAALLLDLDRFKTINDSLTHATGDKLLCEIAGRLTEIFRDGDTVARLGGDEFMIVLTDVRSRERVAAQAQYVLETVSRPLKVTQHQIVVSCSIGIAVFPGDGESPDDLIKNADVAMYRAKALGGNRFQFYAPEMNARMLDRLELENDLRAAVPAGQLELYYQPKVDAAGTRIVGAEALIRWHHPQRGLIAPAQFIPLAEETGLILSIGAWIFAAACAQLRRWIDAGLPDFVLSVNLSVRQLQQDGLDRLLSAQIARYALPPGKLELEVTESALMISPDKSLRVLQRLKAIGVRIALDDFGTGYASLSYLKHFPIDTLKVDQSFVRGVEQAGHDAAIARMVIDLGHDLGMKVVAEGVETDAQRNFLHLHHCDEMQGFFFSRPMPAGEFAALLRADGQDS